MNIEKTQSPVSFYWEAAECRTESGGHNIKTWKFFALLSSA